MNDRVTLDDEGNATVTVVRTLRRDDDDAWWTATVEEGLREADAGNFASDARVQALRKKWADILAKE